MAEMTHEYSNFPETLYSVHNFFDLDDAPINVASTIVQIKNLILNQNYQAASQLLWENKDVLSKYMIDARFINALEEEIRNLEIYTQTRVQGLFYQEREPDGVAGDVWIA